MEPQILHYVLMLAKENNFTKAAQKLHLSQPSLSYQISKLEKDLGIRLFTREHGAVLPTYAGETFISHANQIIDQFQQLRKELIDIEDMNRGELLLGSLSTTGAYLLPRAISIFREKYPNIKFTLIEDSSVNLQSMVLKGEVEIAITSLPISQDRVDVEYIFEENIYLAVPKNHWLSKEKEVNLSLCKDESFIFIKEGNNFRQLTYNLCLQAGFHPNIVFDSINIDTCRALVTTGLGITFIPEMSRKHDDNEENNPVYIPLKKNGQDQFSKRKVAAIYKRNRYLSKPSKAFIEILNSLYSK